MRNKVGISYMASFSTGRRISTEVPREFGGTELSWSDEVKHVGINAKTDRTALHKASGIAKETGWKLFQLTKKFNISS